MQSFDQIWQRALTHHDAAELEASLPQVKSPRSLARIDDHRWLAEMTRCVFRAGFVWKIVEAKWPGFEAAFDAFDVSHCAMLSDEDLEHLATDEGIIRNAAKIRAVRDNARFVLEVRAQHGGFGKFAGGWPDDDIIGLWEVLKKRGARLGGMSGPMMLRQTGRDTFMLSGDVVKTLIDNGVVGKAPTSRRDLAAVQAAFNQWRAQSGRPLAHISRILAAAQG